MLIRIASLAIAPMWFGGCASIHHEFEVARALALADPGPPGDDWVADAVLDLSAAQIHAIVASASSRGAQLATTFDLGLIVVEPTLELDRLDVRAGATCPDCLQADAALSGDLAWTSPFLSGRAPLAVSGRIEGELGVTRDEGWALVVTPRDVSDVHVTLGSVGGALGDVEGLVASWLESALAEGLPPIELARLGRDEVPIRAVRVRPVGEAVRIEILSAARVGGVVAVGEPPPAEGFRLSMSTVSIAALSRAEAYRRGPITRSIVVVPNDVRIDGNTFEIGLRLWRVKGRGWWRDYIVTGSAELRPEGLVLVPITVVEDGHSRGAAWADPMLALGEGALLRSIAQAIDTTLPISAADQGFGLVAEVVLRSIRAEGETLVATGSIGVAQQPARSYPPSPTP